MKSILRLMAITIVAMAFVACTDDADNPVSGATGQAFITVNVKSLFEKLEAVTEINQEMADPEAGFIVGTVLIYDSNGDLIEQLSDTTRQLDPLTFEVKNIPNGTYTLVACEYLGDTYDTFWELSDVEKLSTVRMDYGNLFYPVIHNALGVVSETITIDGGTIEADVTPEVAGSNLTLRVEGVREKDDIDHFIVYEFPFVQGIYLNPALSDAERAYAPDSSASWSVLELYWVNPGSSWYRTFVLSGGGNHSEYMVQYFNEENESTYLTTYDMDMQKGGKENLLYYDFNDWNMNWMYGGLAENFADWKKEKDEQLMTFNLCKWGSSLDEVKEHVKATHAWYHNDTDGNLEEWDGSWEEQFTTGRNHDECYGFETQDGKNLKYVLYIIDVENLPATLITNSLVAQGYELQEEPTHEDDYTFYPFLSADKTVRVEFNAYDSGVWNIWFFPNDSKSAVHKRAQGINRKVTRKHVTTPTHETNKFVTRTPFKTFK